MNTIKALIDEPEEMIGAALVLLATVGYLVDAYAVDYIEGTEVFWTVALAGGAVYGAKLLSLVKRARDMLEDKE